MNRLSIAVEDVGLVLQKYDQIKVYRGDTQGGTFTEITTASTRIPIIPEGTIYWYTDATGTTSHWYKTSYYHSTTTEESEQSAARQGGTQAEKVGHSFGNYEPPPGEWGEVLTPDDLRYTYLFGIDTVGSNSNADEWEDEQFRFHIRAALGDWERWLTMDIRKRVYKADPESTLVRSSQWRTGVDYTDEDDWYPFEPRHWSQFGFMQLRHWPVLSIERCELYNPLRVLLLNLKDCNWVSLNKQFGQLQMYPSSAWTYGPFNAAIMPLRYLNMQYPRAFRIDYTTGYLDARYVPDELRQLIGMWAAIRCLDAIGDGLLAGFSSQSVSLDGLSESFSSTQSATSAYFGARIESYMKQLKEIYPKIRYKFSPIPMAFIGGD